MARTSNIFARVEPEVKEQAERVLEQLGIPMSNAIGLFLRQVVLQRGIPFEMKLPKNKPTSFSDLTDAQFDAEIEKGLVELAAGKVTISFEPAVAPVEIPRAPVAIGVQYTGGVFGSAMLDRMPGIDVP